MTLQEAKEALKQGKKVSHRFMEEHEFVYQIKEDIITEDGFDLHETDFFAFRTDEAWQQGWFIVNK